MDYDNKDFYAILGVSSNASHKEIKKAFRVLAKKYHPDITKLDPKKAEKIFKKISEAYENLSDPVKRQEYDAKRKSGNYQAKGNGTAYDSQEQQRRQQDQGEASWWDNVNFDGEAGEYSDNGKNEETAWSKYSRNGGYHSRKGKKKKFWHENNYSTSDSKQKKGWRYDDVEYQNRENEARRTADERVRQDYAAWEAEQAANAQKRWEEEQNRQTGFGGNYDFNVKWDEDLEHRYHRWKREHFDVDADGNKVDLSNLKLFSKLGLVVIVVLGSIFLINFLPGWLDCLLVAGLIYAGFQRGWDVVKDDFIKFVKG